MSDGKQNYQLSQDNFENIAKFGLSRVMYKKYHDDKIVFVSTTEHICAIVSAP